MDSSTLDLSRIEGDPVLGWKAELAPAAASQPRSGRVGATHLTHQYHGAARSELFAPL
jgi:hypothetical protein